MLKILKETERAIQINLIVDNDFTEQTFKKLVWIPKSQLEENGMPKVWILNAKFKEIYQYEGHKGFTLRGVEVQ